MNGHCKKLLHSILLLVTLLGTFSISYAVYVALDDSGGGCLHEYRIDTPATCKVERKRNM